MMQIKYRRELVELMKHLNLPLIGVEVGVAEGRFSKELLDLGMEKLYSVDNWDTIIGQRGDGGFEKTFHDKNYVDAKKLLKPYGERSVIIKGMSDEVADSFNSDKLSLVYFDGDHSYYGVMKDLLKWTPKVINGGIIATHDYLNKDYGVKQAFDDFLSLIQPCEIHLLPEDKDEDSGAYFIKQ